MQGYELQGANKTQGLGCRTHDACYPIVAMMHCGNALVSDTSQAHKIPGISRPLVLQVYTSPP